MKYRQKRPAPCTFYGTITKCDVYRHVAHRHLELAQLWRCPVSWCTVWRGTPQDLMDHIRDAHNVPGEIRKVSLDSHTTGVCGVPDSSTFGHFKRCTPVQRGLIIAGSSLSSAQKGPSNCCVSWEVFGAAALSPTGEHSPVNSGRAIRRCLLAGAVDGRSDGCFGYHASSAQTSPAASTGHEYACTDRASTYGAGPADGGGSRGV